MAEKPKRVSEMTKEEREAFKKNIRKPKNIVNQSGVTTTIGPDFNKDGTIKRTYKQKREDMSKTPGVLPKIIKKTTVEAEPVKKKPKKSAPKGQAEKGASPLEGKPRSIAAARKAGEKYFFDSKGVKKLAVTGEELKKKGMTLKEWANSFAKKKQTKRHAESLKGFAATKKRAGGMMKKKTYAKGGKVLKMRGGGLATRGMNFKIR